MTALGIVGCRIFEDEITHVLANDPDIDRIFIIENEENNGLLHKLESEGLKPVVLPFYKIKADLKYSNKFSVIVQLQGMGLHLVPARLKSKTYTNVDLMSRLVDGILLFYGSCGRAFSRIRKDFTHTGCPIELLQDRDTCESIKPLEDCIAAALGGNSRYREILKSHSDTFFLTPMWAINWKTAFRVGDELLLGFEFTPEHLRELGYRKVARVNTKLSYESDFEKKIEEFAHNFGFEIIELEGSTEIVQKSYNQMRNMLFRPLKV
jgi:hypothetical protein